jgi:hypothetical protein
VSLEAGLFYEYIVNRNSINQNQNP